MARGRKRLPDSIKALMGNPGKRKLALDDEYDPIARSERPNITMPEFLTHEREKEIFRRVVEDYMQKRIASEVDLISYGRWASYVHEWWSCKEALEGKSRFIKQIANGNERFVSHPLWTLMKEYEQEMRGLEACLGLNPLARNNILRGLAAMPAAIGGLLISNQPGTVYKEEADDQSAPPPDESESPLGFLRRATEKFN
jgi:phage terminase small subunit